PEVRRRAHHRELRRGLGAERSPQGAQDGAGVPRRGPRARGGGHDLLEQPRDLLRAERAPAARASGGRARGGSAGALRGQLGAPGSDAAGGRSLMQRTVVLLVVGLTRRLVGVHTPHLARLAKKGAQRPLPTITPAVTCSVQSTFVTGALPREHGIVANGWYFRDLAEVWLWRQSNHLDAGKKVGALGRDRDPTLPCATAYWWNNRATSAGWPVPPRPMYPADGRKLPDVYAHPSELRDELNGALGTFPLFNFWGPLADLRSSRWITDATKRVFAAKQPTLTLTYLPHLDY